MAHQMRACEVVIHDLRSELDVLGGLSSFVGLLRVRLESPDRVFELGVGEAEFPDSLHF